MSLKRMQLFEVTRAQELRETRGSRLPRSPSLLGFMESADVKQH